MKTIQAIETEYGGFTFRSRLEARWAAFFDLCGWDWEYEPIDLPGWIPDFKIGNVLIEVKPFSELEEFHDQGAIEKAEEAMKKANYICDLLLLGTSPKRSNEIVIGDIGYDVTSDTNIGWLGQLNPILNDWEYDEAIFGNPDYDDIHTFDFCHFSGGWTHQVSGIYTGVHPRIEFEIAQRMWGKAHAATRWNPREKG